MVDVAIVGAGPVGLACALHADRLGLRSLVFDKGALVNSLLGYPTGMEFFSTPDLLEIGGYPLVTARYKPVREEVIDYYRRVAEAADIRLRLFETAKRLHGSEGAFRIETERGITEARYVILATGFFDIPNRLDVPGEDLPKVTHYYREPFAYAFRDVAVIGAKNSAAKAALECVRTGARVTLVVRGSAIGESVKYWIRPDLVNRIEEGAITAYFNTRVQSITASHIHLETPDGPLALPNDVVLAMTGYRPDYDLLSAFGVTSRDDEARTPTHDDETFETNRPGLFLAGTVCGGLRTSRWFIENGRFHAQVIAGDIRARVTV